jgi:hypothetical protein
MLVDAAQDGVVLRFVAGRLGLFGFYALCYAFLLHLSQKNHPIIGQTFTAELEYPLPLGLALTKIYFHQILCPFHNHAQHIQLLLNGNGAVLLTLL